MPSSNLSQEGRGKSEGGGLKPAEASAPADPIGGLKPQEEAVLASQIAREQTTHKVRRNAGARRNSLLLVGRGAVELPHPDPTVGEAMLMEGLGTADPDFARALVDQLLPIYPNGGSSGGKLEFLLSVLRDAKPKDHIDAMLTAQTAVTHLLTMDTAERLMRAQKPEERQLHESAYNRLARTFSAQVEARKRYQTGGEQKITVQHVQNVVAGQAIVGNVTHTGSKSATDPASSTAATQFTPALRYSPQPKIPELDEPAHAPARAQPRGRRK